MLESEPEYEDDEDYGEDDLDEGSFYDMDPEDDAILPEEDDAESPLGYSDYSSIKGKDEDYNFPQIDHLEVDVSDGEDAPDPSPKAYPQDKYDDEGDSAYKDQVDEFYPDSVQEDDLRIESGKAPLGFPEGRSFPIDDPGEDHEAKALEELDGIFREMDEEVQGGTASLKASWDKAPEPQADEVILEDSGGDPGDLPKGSKSPRRVLAARPPVPVKKPAGEESQTILLTERVEEAMRENEIRRRKAQQAGRANMPEARSQEPRLQDSPTKITSRIRGPEPPVITPRRISEDGTTSIGGGGEDDPYNSILMPKAKDPVRISRSVDVKFPPRNDQNFEAQIPMDWSDIRAKGEADLGNVKISELSAGEFSELVEKAVEKALSRVLSRLRP